MIETPTISANEVAFRAAHVERARAFAAIFAFLATPFRGRTRPQGAARGRLLHPHARPVGL